MTKNKSMDNDLNDDEDESEIMDRIVGHFDSKQRVFIDVPEWGLKDKPLRIWVSPMTVHQRNLIYKDKNGVIDMRVMVDAVINKSEHHSGKKMFSKFNRSRMMNQVDDVVLSRVAKFILDVPDDADLEGN